MLFPSLFVCVSKILNKQLARMLTPQWLPHLFSLLLGLLIHEQVQQTEIMDNVQTPQGGRAQLGAVPGPHPQNASKHLPSTQHGHTLNGTAERLPGSQRFFAELLPQELVGVLPLQGHTVVCRRQRSLIVDARLPLFVQVLEQVLGLLEDGLVLC